MFLPGVRCSGDLWDPCEECFIDFRSTFAEVALQEAEMKNARVLIVDDHEIFRRGLRALLEPSLEWQICGEAVDGMDAVEQCLSLKPDIVVLDVSMPRLNGLEAARLIKKQTPEPQIVIITQHDSPQIRSAAVEAGARAFVTKSAVGSELVSALRTIIQGLGETAPD
jgi:DNA-binding NarL/FixJ family response regulator